MTEETKTVMHTTQCANIIIDISELYCISLQ